MAKKFSENLSKKVTNFVAKSFKTTLVKVVFWPEFFELHNCKSGHFWPIDQFLTSFFRKVVTPQTQ